MGKPVTGYYNINIFPSLVQQFASIIRKFDLILIGSPQKDLLLSFSFFSKIKGILAPLPHPPGFVTGDRRFPLFHHGPQ